MFKKYAALVLMAGMVFSSDAKPKPDFSEAKEVLLRGIMNRSFPGATVCVGTDENILWSEAFGTFDYKHKTRVTRKTIYDLASCTKVAGTTSAYMRLVALGKLQITDPVEKYLPEFVSAAADDAEKALRQRITVEHLLTHSGGISGWQPFWKDPAINSYDKLIHAVLHTPLERPPGVRASYSDLSMMLAGEVATRAGGKPLDKLEQELVFRPLKMNDTMRNPPEKFWKRIPPTEKWPDKEEFVHGVVHDENARAGEGITGHAGLFSTAEDLAKLASELLRGLDGKSKLFPREIVSEFFHERKTATNSGRGIGWVIASHKSEDGETSAGVSHTGFTGTSIRIDTGRKLYIILLTNRVHPTRDNDRIGRVRRELTETVSRAFDQSLAGE